MEEARTLQTNKALHKGFTNIADFLVENGISLEVAFKNMHVRPTPTNIKDIFRESANKKFNITSTAEMTGKQIDEVWEEIIFALSENTGVFIPFPSRDSEAFNSIKE